MSIKKMMKDMAGKARQAAVALARASSEEKNAALEGVARALEDNCSAIQKENEKDLEQAHERGLSPAMIDRLRLNDERMKSMIEGVRDIVRLEDPVGRTYDESTQPSGLKIHRMRVPIGVIGIVYESRPNVTVDAGALTLKTGNAVILRGGSEAINSNLVLGRAMAQGIESAGLPAQAVQVVATTDREAVGELLVLDDLIDLIIPRGGKELIRRVVESSTIPVIKHYNGICHVYVHRAADIEMAEEIAFNAKVQRPGVCNAMETLLVDSAVAGEFLPRIFKRLKGAGVDLVGCSRTREVDSSLAPATEEDWEAEYLELKLSVRVVDGLDQAVEHIERYGSRHTDAIVTGDRDAAQEFIQRVDSSSVMVNVSTRFSDGAQYGLGAEIGISTDKLHARGPMGLEELTTYKWVVLGDGQLRE